MVKKKATSRKKASRKETTPAEPPKQELVLEKKVGDLIPELEQEHREHQVRIVKQHLHELLQRIVAARKIVVQLENTYQELSQRDVSDVAEELADRDQHVYRTGFTWTQ